jgi:hypothetical protein
LGDSIVATVNYFDLNKDIYQGTSITGDTVRKVRGELLDLPAELVLKLIEEVPEIRSFINEKRSDILDGILPVQINDSQKVTRLTDNETLITEDTRRHFEAVWQLAREWSKQIYYYMNQRLIVVLAECFPRSLHLTMPC